MKITVIPAYAYWNNTAVRNDVYILQSNFIIEKLKQQGSYSWSGLHDKNLAKVNQWLGDSLLSNKYTLYMAWNNNSTNQTVNPNFNDVIREQSALTGLHLETYQVPDTYQCAGNTHVSPDRMIGLNNSQIGFYGIGSAGGPDVGNMYLNWFEPLMNQRYYITGSGSGLYMTFYVLPEFDMITDDKKIDLSPLQELGYVTINISATTGIVDNEIEVSTINITSTIHDTGGATAQTWANRLSQFDTVLSGLHEENNDPDDPYGKPDSSAPGGGDGSYGNPDAINPAVIPALPNINVCDLGLITMYNPSQSQVKALSDFLWSSAFDLVTYKKLFGDPMEGIIGLAIVPVAPTLGGSKNVKIGNIDSEVNMPFLASNWAEVDCGWCDIEKYVGCFMDADPYTKISVYLPFIGIRSLSADDINGGSIHIVYHVDVLTGACACFIEHSERGVLYTYNGSCITNVPLTAINFSGAIQNAVSAVISGIGVAAGMATGAAPVTAMSAAGLLNSAANTAINSKPHVQRSGNLGGSAGILSILTPYVIIERPQLSVPYNLQHYIGQTSNITYYLSQLSGFTMCEYVHIENCTGTSEEIAEIEALLKEGVYL